LVTDWTTPVGAVPDVAVKMSGVLDKGMLAKLKPETLSNVVLVDTAMEEALTTGRPSITDPEI